MLQTKKPAKVPGNFILKIQAMMVTNWYLKLPPLFYPNIVSVQKFKDQPATTFKKNIIRTEIQLYHARKTCSVCVNQVPHHHKTEASNKMAKTEIVEARMVLQDQAVLQKISSRVTQMQPNANGPPIHTQLL